MLSKKKSIIAGILSATILAGMVTPFIIPSISTNATYELNSMSPGELERSDLDITVKYISLSEGQEIDDAVSAATSTPTKSSETVNVRDWDSYMSDYAYDKLPVNAKMLCNRLDEIFKYYIEHSDTDIAYVESFDKYFCNGAIYSDLGFTSEEAIEVATWFLYTHPQYYYIKPYFAVTDKAVYIACYDEFYNGSIRAAVTNDLFDQIDTWSDQISDDEISTYQIELSAHDMLCDYITYANNEHDQSVYSVVFNNGQTVCVGYATAFSMIMNAADVQTLVGISHNHAWNLVLLDDDNWYGVDLTWDDSLGGKHFFNCGTTSFYRMDGTGESHVYDDVCKTWYPDMPVNDYVPTTYDLTGEYYDTTAYMFDRPYNVVSTRTIDGSYRLTWADIQGSDYYDIEVYEDNVLTGTTVVSTNTLRLTNVDESKPLSVKIRARGTVDGVIGYSDWTTFDFEFDDTEMGEPVLPPVDSDDDDTDEPDADTFTVNTPTNLIVSDNSNNSVRLSWDAVDMSSGYEVYIYSDAAHSNLMTNTVVSANALRLTALNNNLSLYVRVRAFVNVGSDKYYSDWADISVVTDFGDADEPVMPDDTDDPSDTPVDPVDPDEPSGGNDNPSDSDDNTPDDNNDPSDNPGISDDSAIAAPTGLSVSAKTSHSVAFSWDSVTGADCYEVKICNDSDGDSILASTRIKGTRANLTGLSSTSTYYVFIRAIDKDGMKEYTSDWTSLKFSINDSFSDTDDNNSDNNESDTSDDSTTDSGALNAPRLNLSRISDSSVRLYWNNVSSADYYRIEVYSDEGYTSYVTGLNLADTAMKLTSVNECIYYVRVCAVNADSASDWTNIEIAF